MNKPKTPEEIIQSAIDLDVPIAGWFVGFSGGKDSLATTHWMMSHYPQCKVFHCNTGIGIEATRQYVRDTCRTYRWPLIEIRAKEDCGQDYREMVMEHGFPGPAHHYKMYQRLKERCIRVLVRRTKHARSREKILIASGLRREESQVRSGYVDREINVRDAQLWVNPLFWWNGMQIRCYINEHSLPRNPVAAILGMSGECLCGAYAHPGEKALIRQACPATADYLNQLEADVRAAGHDWGWEDSPPRDSAKAERKRGQTFMPFCAGCGKIA